MLLKEKEIKNQLAEGKKIYEIPEVYVFRSKKPSKTEPGQALSIRAHVALAQAGVGSLGITDDMFDFDDSVSVDAAIEKSGATLLQPGVTSLTDLVNHRIAMLRREFKKFESKKLSDSTKKESAGAPDAAPPSSKDGADAAS